MVARTSQGNTKRARWRHAVHGRHALTVQDCPTRNRVGFEPPGQGASPLCPPVFSNPARPQMTKARFQRAFVIWRCAQSWQTQLAATHSIFREIYGDFRRLFGLREG